MIDANRTGIIAFQGEAGANSDTASRDCFPKMTPLPCTTFEDAFDAVTSGEAHLAMIPIENTLAGRVADIHALLPDSGLRIVGEHFLPIHFDLMAKPGTTIDDIEIVHSHIHGLPQCKTIIRDNGWQGIVVSDTAGAARMVSEMEERNVAALAPSLAAQLYGLDVLRAGVEDADHNTTRFIVLSREPEWPARDAGDAITTFVFRVRNVA
ncbi:MAG: prephenate dehydratase domain-containing protein, partial [Pseudomonadota bacterium]